uniref:Alanine--tRNA ligase n=1 Tax=Piliocolobus tephrosceles TaxID=591936 RepID=A0A8C9LNP2_9PRIM
MNSYIFFFRFVILYFLLLTEQKKNFKKIKYTNSIDNLKASNKLFRNRKVLCSCIRSVLVSNINTHEKKKGIIWNISNKSKNWSIKNNSRNNRNNRSYNNCNKKRLIKIKRRRYLKLYRVYSFLFNEEKKKKNTVLKVQTNCSNLFKKETKNVSFTSISSTSLSSTRVSTKNTSAIQLNIKLINSRYMLIKRVCDISQACGSVNKNIIFYLHHNWIYRHLTKKKSSYSSSSSSTYCDTKVLTLFALKNKDLLKMDTSRMNSNDDDNKLNNLGSSISNNKLNNSVLTSEEVRNKFLKYFEDKNHTIVESASVIPYNDNTLLFTNAGMNQFKKIFLGNIDKNSEFGKLKRAVDTQKCIRAGGKHNDLDDVGKDVYHHTFFEMLGNWSFGDYFKKESIAYAWDLLTNVYKINPDRLYVTYFGGDKQLSNCTEDIETKNIWLQYVNEERILPFGMKENFWEMAETGPCGPCSEIHYDRIGNRDASSLVNMDDSSVLEIWNIVFMQYNKDEHKNMNKLPYPCIDTGMGLERITSILQNVNSNYDTDLFIPIFKEIKKMFPSIPEYQGKVNEEDINKIDYAYRVISDHIRCVTVAISDGCIPSNEGRNYVIRRIIRRAIRVGKQYFNIKSDVLWFYKLVDAVSDILGNCFKDLKNEKKINYIKNVIKQEEMLFNKTLEKGVEQFNKIIKKCQIGKDTAVRSNANDGTCINGSFKDDNSHSNKQVGTFRGKDAFDLYTSYGFPIDLIEIMCEEKKIKLNIQEFNDLFKKHQLVSDTNNFKITKFFDLPVEKAHELKSIHKINATIDDHKYIWNNNELPNDMKLKTVVKAIYDGNSFLKNISFSNNTRSNSIDSERSSSNSNNTNDSKENPKYALILNETNFYHENGGQIYDIGYIQNEHMKFDVLNVQKINDYVLHIGQLIHGTIKTNDTVETLVNYDRRKLIACNHTATHLLNFVLRKVLMDQFENVKKEKDNEKRENTTNDESKQVTNCVISKTQQETSNEESTCSIFDCEQKGSLVDEEKLRFDFSFFENISIELIKKIEDEINEIIEQKLSVVVKTMDLAESKKIKGLRAIFEEDYADNVNVVFINKDVDSILKNPQVNYTKICSIELCGGTHIANTEFIKKFIITSEESIGKGIYRFTAVTNKRAEEISKKFDDLYEKYKHIFNDPNENELTQIHAYKRVLKEDKFLPYIKKNNILQKIEIIEKNIVEKNKNMQKELFNNATNLGKSYALENKNNTVLDIKLFNELNGNQKVLEKIVQSYNKNNKSLSYFFIISDQSNTYCVFEIKDSLKNKNIQANSFMKDVMQPLGGHSGGSKSKSFGSTTTDKVGDLKKNVEKEKKKYLLKNVIVNKKKKKIKKKK